MSTEEKSKVTIAERNISVDFFRFFFIVMICLWHFSDKIRVFYHGYLGVEFFFMLSGMYLYRTYCSHPELNALDYTTKRFVKFFPKYVFCLIPIFVLVNYLWLKDFSLASVIYTFLRFISEGLMLQSFGLFPSGANYPMWFLSVLLVGGGFVYSILRIDKRKALGFLFPIFSIFAYMYIFSDNKNCIERWGHPDGFYIPFIRGIADICLGVMLMAVITYKRSLLEKNVKAIDCISILSLILLMLLTLIKPFHDQYSLIFISFILISCFIKQSVYNRIFIHQIWTKLGNISYEMFLVHAFIIKVYAHSVMPIISSSLLAVIGYMACVILVALFIHWLFETVFNKKWLHQNR